jgi:hypothetical protein
MVKIPTIVLLCVSAALCTGCGGQYVLTVPEQVVPAGEQAVPVVRLQRNEVYVYAQPVRRAAMRFSVAEGPVRGAYTDELGYAGTYVPTPDKPGRYELTVKHLDYQGDQVRKSVPVYVWDPARAALAVDIDALPWLRGEAISQASAALNSLARDANVLYLTRSGSQGQKAAYNRLAEAGFPDGPILMWQRESWYIVRQGRWNLPRVVVSARMVSQLPDLVKQFPNLKHGLAGGPAAADAFAKAGMTVLTVGPTLTFGAGAGSTQPLETWADLGELKLD